MHRLLQRAFHLWERIVRESKVYFARRKTYGARVANASFIDGLIPPGKSQKYITVISEYVDAFLQNLVEKYNSMQENNLQASAQGDNDPIYSGKIIEKFPIWCCWWQGVDQMPELVRMCHERLKQVIPQEKAQLHLITLENYKEYVDLPEGILQKFDQGIITMTTMSDVLRFHLLDRYGGYWLDATVFFTGDIPEQYFSGEFYCQRMVNNQQIAKREACGCNWCGFSMAGPKGSLIFRFMKDAFAKWWENYDSIIDYVLIDYMLLTAFRHVPAIHQIIDEVEDNNEDIFEMYQVLDKPYSQELMERLTRRNVMHKLTYKIDLKKETEDGQMTLYAYLLQSVYGNEDKS